MATSQAHDKSIPGLKPLLLAGGNSTRMGCPKHLLITPAGIPLYQQQVQVLRAACPAAPQVYVSLARSSPKDAYLREVDKEMENGVSSNELGITIIYDELDNDSDESAGPAMGLLSAFNKEPTATWLVLACDYPFVTPESLLLLQADYRPPATCYRNLNGFCEPLVGIWSPQALAHLSERCSEGMKSPARAIEELRGRVTHPMADTLLLNVNTKEEWMHVFGKLSVTKN
ncbi:molybdenum cofactor biosynthesis protein C [Stachybotrys elegans]|uniref:Molybdenum cofactor biosynthesis protein C n=1 Tax=Stachybotrys elegans TaxID=80388 RepID=A0A8K0SS64_9HYPO|nr:molybdenum cofactor biosynthesis protein C [Stachybotrys elegans]